MESLLKSTFLASVLALFTASVSFAAEPPGRITLPPGELVPGTKTRSITAVGPEWNLNLLKVTDAWGKTKGKGVVVTVLDTGIDSNHPDLKNRVKKVKDFSGSPFGATDKQGHGTHTAGTVAAEGDLPGVAPQADLIIGKVLGDDGSGGVDAIAAGIDWAVENGADVITMSLGGASTDSFIPPALKRAIAAGVIVVCAAGNDGPGENTIGYPGGYPESIAVAACDVNRNIASFSSRGKNVFCAAPGVNIRSTYPGGQYATMSGTSMACPHVAGLAALWVSSHSDVAKKDRPAKFRADLKAACNFQDQTTARGWGLPDATKLVPTGTTPIPVDPKPPTFGTVRLTLADLTAEAKAKLTQAGITTFDLSFGGNVYLNKPVPAPDPVPLIPPAGCVGGNCPTTPQPGTTGQWRPFGGRFR